MIEDKLRVLDAECRTDFGLSHAGVVTEYVSTANCAGSKPSSAIVSPKSANTVSCARRSR